VRLRGGARAALAAAAEVVAPERRRFGFDERAWCLGFVESYVAYLPTPMRELFPVGLFLLEWAALLLGEGRRFSRLDLARRRAFIHRIESSRLLAPLAGLWLPIRGIVACAFYSHPAVAAHLGYAHQPWIDAKIAERRERFGAPEPW
jgi:hypothetical protein